VAELGALQRRTQAVRGVQRKAADAQATGAGVRGGAARRPAAGSARRARGLVRRRGDLGLAAMWGRRCGLRRSGWRCCAGDGHGNGASETWAEADRRIAGHGRDSGSAARAIEML